MVCLFGTALEKLLIQRLPLPLFLLTRLTTTLHSPFSIAAAYIRSQEIQAETRKIEATELNEARRVEAQTQADARRAEALAGADARRAEAQAAADAREAEAAASCIFCCSCFWVPWLTRTMRRRVRPLRSPPMS